MDRNGRENPTALTNYRLHIVLFACVLLEIVTLEVVALPWLRLSANAAIISIFVAVAAVVGRTRIPAIAAALCGAAAWTIDYANAPQPVVEPLLWAGIHVAVGMAVAYRVRKTANVRTSEIVDAVTVYMLAGIFFANLYAARMGVFPGALVRSDGMPILFEDLVYFSFVTQLTVGYGDIVPLGNLTRAIVILQSLFGVFYVAILISKLVSVADSDKP